MTKKKPFQNTVEILAKGDSVVVQVLGDKTTINGYTFDLTDPVQRAACEQYSDWLKNHRRDEIEALFGTKVDDSG